MSKKVLGNNANVTFTQFHCDVEGKVDTGATTSSLHAVDIEMSHDGAWVTCVCPAISSNRLRLPCQGTQEVHSADAGGVSRPVVKLDITVGGVTLPDVAFNLNDRSGMDSQLLIGQNILQAGEFIINPQEDNTEPSGAVKENATYDVERERQIIEAIETLTQHNVSINEMVMYMQTVAVKRIKD